MLLRSDNTYQGSTQILEGTLILLGEAGERLPELTNVLLNGGSLRLQKATGVAETIGSLSGSGNVTFSVNLNQILRVGANNSDSTFDGIIKPVSGGDGALTKIGAGTLTLSGTNT